MHQTRCRLPPHPFPASQRLLLQHMPRRAAQATCLVPCDLPHGCVGPHRPGAHPLCSGVVQAGQRVLVHLVHLPAADAPGWSAHHEHYRHMTESVCASAMHDTRKRDSSSVSAGCKSDLALWCTRSAHPGRAHLQARTQQATRQSGPRTCLPGGRQRRAVAVVAREAQVYGGRAPARRARVLKDCAEPVHGSRSGMWCGPLACAHLELSSPLWVLQSSGDGPHPSAAVAS